MTGLEPCRWAVEKARELYQLDVRCGSIFEGIEQRQKFDAVTMWDVIEHLYDPLAAVAAIYDCLKPGGTFAVSTMDIASRFASWCGPKWPWLMRMHIYYFTTDTLIAMLRQAGYEIVCVRKHFRTISVRYLLKKAASLSWPVERFLEYLPVDRLVKGLYVPISMGDLIEVYARRPLRGAMPHPRQTDSFQRRVA